MSLKSSEPTDLSSATSCSNKIALARKLFSPCATHWSMASDSFSGNAKAARPQIAVMV